MVAVESVNAVPAWRPDRHLAVAQVMEPGHGVWASALVLAALELGVFDELGKGPRSCAQLQRSLGLDPQHAADLLDALLGLGWLERDGDDPQAVYLNTREAAPLLDRRSLAYLGDTLQSWHAPLRDASRGLADLLRGRARAAVPTVDASLREGLAQLHGRAIGAALEVPAATTWLDVRGAAGRLAAALAPMRPGLRGTVLDHGVDAARARAHLQARGLAERIDVLAVDSGHGAPGAWPACDLLTVHAVLLPGGDEHRRQLLTRAQTALRPGGLLVVVDQLLDAPRRHSSTALTLALLRRAADEAVVPTGLAGWRDAAASAGFGQIEPQPLADGASALLVRR